MPNIEIKRYNGTAYEVLYPVADYATLINKPATFTPTAHTHDDRYYTETEVDNLLNGKDNYGQWNVTAASVTASMTSGDGLILAEGVGINLTHTGDAINRTITIAQVAAASTTLGGLKARLATTTLYLRNDGSAA